VTRKQRGHTCSIQGIKGSGYVLGKETFMSQNDPGSWLFLLFNLPAKHSSDRVKVWRRLKKVGAIQLKTSTYVLPDEAIHYERFQWLAKEIVDNGGEAALVRVKDIEGTPYSAVVAMFDEARARDYDEIAEPLTLLIKDARGRKTSLETLTSQVQKLRQRYQDIRDIDFFQSSRGEDLERLFRKAESLESSNGEEERKERLRVEDYQGKTWITRPRPEIDRASSAWLIHNFIDPEAKFVFAKTPAKHDGALPYDMIDSEFSEDSDRCTFETLIKRFGIRERAVLRLAEIVHDADLGDDKFHRVEGFGLDQILKGWAKQGISDEEILARAFQCLDGLHAHFKRA
jgi:hypothetical protein